MTEESNNLSVTLRQGNYEVVRRRGGFHSIRDSVSGETLHSVIDPEIEAKTLYVGQSDLPARMLEDHTGPLVIWDVGLGAAANAMAAVREIERLRSEGRGQRAVTIVSFENDLDSFRLVLGNPSLFPYIRHPAPLSIMENGLWEDSASGISWRLFQGDFTENFEKAPSPDIIYYDMYSVEFNGRLWSMRLFRRLFDHCTGKRARLITYTVSTRARAALLAAGFSVCYGAGSGPKTETTIAFTSIDEARLHPRPLGREWRARWERSTAKTDPALSDEEKEHINRNVIFHPQFAVALGEHA